MKRSGDLPSRSTLWSVEAPSAASQRSDRVCDLPAGRSSCRASSKAHKLFSRFFCQRWNLRGGDWCGLPATFVLLLRKLPVSHKIPPPPLKKKRKKKNEKTLPPSLPLFHRLQTEECDGGGSALCCSSFTLRLDRIRLLLMEIGRQAKFVIRNKRVLTNWSFGAPS